MHGRNSDTFIYDRIEILRGASSVLHGTQGVGSAINFVSKSPSRTSEPLDLQVGYGTHNALRLGAGKGGAIGTAGTAFYRIDASTSRFGTDINGNRQHYDRVVGTVLFDISTRLNISLSADWQNENQQDAYWGTPLNNGKIDASLRKINYNNLTDNKFDARALWLRGVVEWKPSDTWSVKNTLYQYDSHRDWRNVENYAYNAAAGTVTRSSFGDLDHDHKMLGNRLEILHKGTLFGLPNRVSFGLDINRTDFKSQRNGFPGAEVVSALTPPAVSFNSVTAINKFPARDVSIDQQAFFAEDQLSLTKQLKIVGGVRLDRINATFIRTDVGAVAAPTAAVSAQKTWDPTSTRLGLVYDVTPAMTVYGQYTRANEPVGTLLLLNQTSSQFDLTKARMGEIGLKSQFWEGRGEFTAAAYQIVKNNVLVNLTPAIQVQAGQQSSRGFELSAGVRPSPVLKLEANAAVLRARFDSFAENVAGVVTSRDGNTPQNVPQKIFNAGARYKWLPELELGAWARHVGKRYTDTANRIDMPAYTVLDLSTSYQMSRTTNLQFWVRNLADKLYAQYRGASNDQVILGAARSFELVLRTSF